MNTRFGSVRFGTGVEYHNNYNDNVQTGLSLQGSIKLLKEDLALVKALKPYSTHFEVQKEVQVNNTGVTLLNRIIGLHPRLNKSKSIFTLQGTTFIDPDKVIGLNEEIIKHAQYLHDLLVEAGLAKTIKKTTKSKVADE